MRERTWPWVVLLLAVVAWFFHESLFQNHSLVPTDLLHNLMLPYCSKVAHVKVQNHYAMDALTTDFPLGLFWQQSVQRDRELPLWNPYILGGHPNLADSMPAVVSPFKLLYLVLPAERAMTLGIVLEFALAGLFMFGLLRQLGRSRPASFLGACAWMLNSAFLMWYWRQPNAFCWAPLVLWLLERSARRDDWANAAGAGLALGLALLSGNIQAGAHLGFLCTVYGFCMVRWRRPMLGRVVFVLVTGVLVSAVQWVPALELMAHDAYAAAQSRGTVVSLRHTVLGIPALITFVFPALTGSTESFDLLKVVGGSRYNFTGYIGILPFTLFVIGALACRHEWRVRSALLILAAVVGLIFFTPLVKYLYHRFFVVAVFAMVLIAAYGADAAPKQAWWWMSLLCGLVLVGVAGVQLFGERWMPEAQRYVAREAQKYAFAHRAEWFPERVREFFHHYRLSNVEFWLPTAAVFCTAALWRATNRGRVSPAVMTGALVVVTVVDLCVLGRRTVPQCDLKQYPLHPATSKTVEGDRELFRICRMGPYSAYILRPTWPIAYEWYDLNGNFSMSPESVEQLASHTNEQFNALLDLANVKYVFTVAEYALPSGRFELVTESDGLRLYRNPHCLPRLQFFGQWQLVPDRHQMLRLMTTDSFDPSQTVFLEESPTITPGAGTATIIVERYSANRLIARVNATSAGILLLADTWYPGWKVRVDGQAAPLHRADHVLRATEVPAGEHRVEFYYAPRSVQIGVALSSVGLLAVTYFLFIPKMLTKKLDSNV